MPVLMAAQIGVFSEASSPSATKTKKAPIRRRNSSVVTDGIYSSNDSDDDMGQGRRLRSRPRRSVTFISADTTSGSGGAFRDGKVIPVVPRKSASAFTLTTGRPGPVATEITGDSTDSIFNGPEACKITDEFLLSEAGVEDPRQV